MNARTTILLAPYPIRLPADAARFNPVAVEVAIRTCLSPRPVAMRIAGAGANIVERRMRGMIPPMHLSQTTRPRRGSLCRTIGTIRPPRKPGVDCVWNRLRVSLQGDKVRSARGEWTCPLPGGPNRAGIAPQ